MKPKGPAPRSVGLGRSLTLFGPHSPSSGFPVLAGKDSAAVLERQADEGSVLSCPAAQGEGPL